jgi:hypothetical protein
MEIHSATLAPSNAVSRNWAAIWRYMRGGPSHFFMYVFGRFGIVRSFAVWTYKRTQSSVAAVSGSSLIEDVDVDYAARAISKNGIFPGLRLRREVLENLRQFSSTATCFGEENSRFPFHLSDRAEAEQRYGRPLLVGRLDNILQACPAVKDLASDPTLLAIAGRYLGCQPVFLGARIWWSFASGADAAQQMNLGQGFHYDIDGYRALAFFFYLTDVTPLSGPHICVRGSHTEKPLKSLISFHKGRSDAEIDRWYGTERQMTVRGAAGDGFAEDIFCYHKGLHPERDDRLILQLRYGLRDYRNKS